MAMNQMNIITYNCKHFRGTGDKFDFINTLFCETDFLFLNEHWLYESEFHKLLNLGNGADMVATSGMDENIIRIGRPYGGSAIIWKSSIIGNIEKIDCQSDRLCAILYTKNLNSILFLNVYMPCDNNINNGEYIDILNEVSQLFYKHCPNHVIFGGDMNVDLARSSTHCKILADFIQDFNLYTCIDMSLSDVPYTFINFNHTTSRIDHFFISQSLCNNVTECSIIDNHLYSDHVPLKLCLSIDMSYITEVERPYATKLAWYKASNDDIACYRRKLDECLSKIHINDDLMHCRDIHCVKHKTELCTLYNDLITSCLCASELIPTTTPMSSKNKPGWNEEIKFLKREALSWHSFWKMNSRPSVGYVADMRRISRATYHRAIRHLERSSSKIRMEKMAEALVSNSSRDMWSEVKRLKGRSSKLACSIDGASDDSGIANLFSEKYDALYNSVPYDQDEMLTIESTICSRLQNYTDNDYVLSIADVKAAVHHLKAGKCDGFEGLHSDHFINGTERLFVFISIIFTMFLSHGYTPESMILGTMIPIPKDKRKLLCNSSNYRAIALSSIFSKILDWIILIKEQHSLCSSPLQFGFKKGLSTTQCTHSLLETIDYYNYNRSNVYVLMLDASKAFDRVKYCKLFNELLKRHVSPVILRILLYMYTKQSLRVKWAQHLSSIFTVTNGVKQGGVLSPILFAVYTDGLLRRLSETGAGCHIGSHFVGALAYADDITLVSPSRTGLCTLIQICEQYASEFDIVFNGKKSQLLCFKGRECKPTKCDFNVNGQLVGMSESATHLGHCISSIYRDSIVCTAKQKFWQSFNVFRADFGHIYSFLKCKLFNQYCCSYYGSPLWPLEHNSVRSLCTDWRKALRMLWNVDRKTHCDIITALSNQVPLMLNLQRRFMRFIEKCLSSENCIVRIISEVAISNPMSCAGSNFRSLLDSTGELSIQSQFNEWYERRQTLEVNISVLHDIIDIRDGHKECDFFTNDDIQHYLHDICVR